MFEYVVLRRSSLGEQVIDLGLLAETLLFYQRLHLLLDNGTLSYLLKRLGGETFLALLACEGVSASFMRDNLCTLTSSNGGLTSHAFTQIRFDGRGGPGKQQRLRDREWIELAVEGTLGPGRQSRVIAKKLNGLLTIANWKSPELPNANVPDIARDDLKDRSFVQKAVALALQELVPSFDLPRSWYFRPMLLGDNQFAIDTNFNFDKLNSHYHQSVPVSFNTITPAYLVGQILDARSSLFLGAKYMAEMVTDPATAAIARLKCVELMRKRDHEVREIDLFQELYLPEARTLREAINSGERTFEEFLKLSEASHKFKSWLGTHNPDRTLLGEYYSAATKESWVDALPTRGARWLICTGLSAMAEHFYPAGGAIVVGAQAVSAADALFIDRLLKGWRPNHFIDDVLGPFVAKEGIDSTSAT